MSTTLLEQLITYLLPIITLFGPGFFKRDGLTQSQNGWIALAIVVVLSGLQAYAAGKIGLNPWIDFVAVAGFTTGLLAGPLKWLDEYLQSNVGLKSNSTTATSANVLVDDPSLTFTASGSGVPSTPIILPDTTKQSSTNPKA